MSAKSLEIRDDIPIPTALPPKSGKNMDLLRSMKPGDSIHWQLKDEERAGRFYRVAKRMGIRIMIRRVNGDDPEGVGVRMWRLPDEGESDG